MHVHGRNGVIRFVLTPSVSHVMFYIAAEMRCLIDPGMMRRLDGNVPACVCVCMCA